MKDWIQNLGIATLAALAPIEAMLISVWVIVFTDLFLGMWAAKKRGEKLTSAAMRRTISKLFIYHIVVITGYLLETYLLGGIIPISKIISGAIGLFEFKSILENGNEVLGQDIFETVLLKLGSDNDPKKIKKNFENKE